MSTTEHRDVNEQSRKQKSIARALALFRAGDAFIDEGGKSLDRSS